LPNPPTLPVPPRLASKFAFTTIIRKSIIITE
jgi:hypothetical protein